MSILYRNEIGKELHIVGRLNIVDSFLFTAIKLVL